MPRYDYPDAATATVQPIAEEDLAVRLERDGASVRRFRGRFWRGSRGWWEPVHQLARLSSEEIGRPGLGWGYRAVLAEGDEALANATLPVHLMDDVASFSEDALPRDARRNVRRAWANGVHIVQVTDIRLLADQGHAVALDWSRRVGPPAGSPSAADYLRAVERRLAGGGLVLAALVDDRLVGYSAISAVDHVAYLQEIKVTTAALAWGVTAALDVASMLAIQRNPTLTWASMGLHEPEWPSLTSFKTRNGFPVVAVPARAWLLAPAGRALRFRRPLAYYRLTGRGSPP
jgi:hypothetical protein